jgi:hypothetical protein
MWQKRRFFTCFPLCPLQSERVQRAVKLTKPLFPEKEERKREKLVTRDFGGKREEFKRGERKVR